jgi:hypothetical protein
MPMCDAVHQGHSIDRYRAAALPTQQPLQASPPIQGGASSPTETLHTSQRQ